MRTTQQLHDLGQSLWLDNITRELLIDGTLARYISELSVTGLTSNPSIFDHAIKNGSAYDNAIRQKTVEGKSGEALFFELALEDLTRAADLFRPVYDATGQVDGRVSLEVSPLLANDTASTVEQAAQLHARAQRRISSMGRGGEGHSPASVLRNRFGIAIANRTYKAYRELLASPRWRKLAAAGARPQRLLWASTGTKDPRASDTLYIEALGGP